MRYALIGSVLALASSCVVAEPINLVHGTEEGETLVGSPEVDAIFGGLGDDRIVSGYGADLLFGGPGADTFVMDLMDTSSDTVMDFDPGEGDTLVFEISDDRSRFRIPKSLGTKHFRVNSKGDVKLILPGEKARKLVAIGDPNFALEVKDRGSYIQLTFKTRIR